MTTKTILINLPETIETSRLFLRNPKAGYGTDLFEAIVDGYDDYVRWLAWSPTLPTLQAVEEDCRKHHSEFILREYIRYLIFEKDSNRIIGRCAFPPPLLFWTIPQFGVSYFIRKSARHKGLATEAAHALTLLSFRHFNAKKVEIQCDAENIQSQRIPQKLGFTLEYTKKGGWPRPDNQLADLQAYSIFSEEGLPNWVVKW